MLVKFNVVVPNTNLKSGDLAEYWVTQISLACKGINTKSPKTSFYTCHED